MRVLRHALDELIECPTYGDISTVKLIERAALYARDAAAGRCRLGKGFHLSRPYYAQYIANVRFSRYTIAGIYALFIIVLVFSGISVYVFIGIYWVALLMELLVWSNNPVHAIKASPRNAYQIVILILTFILSCNNVEWALVFIPWMLIGFYKPLWKLIGVIMQTLRSLLYLFLILCIFFVFFSLLGYIMWSDVESSYEFLSYSSVWESFLSSFVLSTTETFPDVFQGPFQKNESLALVYYGFFVVVIIFFMFSALLGALVQNYRLIIQGNESTGESFKEKFAKAIAFILLKSAKEFQLIEISSDSVND
jgi:hypothetical protein